MIVAVQQILLLCSQGVGSSAKPRGLHKLLHAYSSWAVCVGLIYKDKQVIELVNRD